MKSDLISCNLAEIANFRNGKSIPSTKYSPYGEYPVYGSNGKIANTNEILNNNPVIVVGRVGAYCGSIHKIDTPSWTTDNSIVVLPKNNVDFNFLYYKLKSLNLRNLAGGSAQALLTQDTLKNIITQVPSFSHQKKIGSFLNCLDKKIEILSMYNIILEKIVDTIFKFWFVDFFSQHKFIGSELGKIPSGWAVEKLDTLNDIIIDHRGITPKKLKTNWTKIGIPVLSAKHVKNDNIINRDKFRFIDNKTYEKWMRVKIQVNDILLTSEAPVGELYFVKDFNQFCTGQRLFAIRANQKISSVYLFFFLKSNLGQHELTIRSTGTTVQGIRQAELRKVRVLLPSREMMKKFSFIANKIMELKKKNEENILNLSRIKNFLIPKFLSGDVNL